MMILLLMKLILLIIKLESVIEELRLIEREQLLKWLVVS